MVQPGFAPSTQDSVGNDSAGPGSLIGFGSEITGDLRLAGEREWLVTNGLGSYAMGTVSGRAGPQLPRPADRRAAAHRWSAPCW